MKKSYLYILVLLAGFSSCTKDDKPVFDQPADERVMQVTKAYQDQLTGAANGWKGIIYPAGGGAYSFYFKFNDQNRVTMLSDFDPTSAVNYMESSYRMKALQQPALIFDTYSYVHRLADPDPDANGGELGSGLRSDFEFAIDTASADTIRMTGRFNKSKAVLIRATAQEAAAFNNGDLDNGMAFNNAATLVNYFKRLTLGSALYDIAINPVNRSITFTWLDSNGNEVSMTTSYFFTFNGVALTQPLVNGSTTITGFTGISFDAPSATVNLTANGTAGTITGVGKPLKVDLTAPARWWQWSVDNTYSFSWTGFTVNGVVDAFKITQIPKFYYLIYYPKFGFSGSINYDVLGFVKLNATNTAITLPYGAAYRKPTFTTDGRAVFSYLGMTAAVPSADSAAVVNTRTMMADPSGFYFVQTSPDTYDMISAKDGKAWISWEK